ncbi:MAG: hypothetical protein ABFD64_10260 [Armatimonadota bacterium]
MKDKRLAYLALSCAGYIAIWLAVPHLGIFGHPVMILFFVAVFMLTQLSITRWFTSLRLKPVSAAAVMLAAFSATIAIMLFVSAPYVRYETKDGPLPPIKMKPGIKPAPTIELTLNPSPNAKGGNPKHEVKKITALRKPANLGFKLTAFGYFAGKSRAATGLLIVIGASAFGTLVSLILKHPNIILPVAVFSAMIDVWTVLTGPTAKAVANAPKVVEAVSVALPAPGGSYAPISFIGPADVIFFAMFMSALYKLRMEPKRTFWIAVPLLTLGMTAVILSGSIPLLGFLFPGLPALTLIGTAVILGNLKHFKLSRQEYISFGIVMAILIVITTAMTFFTR